MNVLITGAAGGLGRAFAVECARRGYNLFLTDSNAIGLARIRQGILCRFGRATQGMACDITDSSQLHSLLQYASEIRFRFDMLINVAGIDFEGGFLGRDAESIAKIINLNIGATLGVTHRALESRNPGLPFFLVFVSSLASLYPMPLKATYAASKRFLLDFACALRQELRAENVSVLALCPGGLATTEAAVSGIAAQGLMGSITSNGLERLTRRTISRVLAGRPLYIPGLMNGALRMLGKLVPRGIVARIIYLRWRNAQKQWLSAE
ncbi:MAG: SDR family NAD(P)-dependent oxidoreductase [Candidatus Pelethousia sp.]|nr:SDR family NAD(P)-dependent oxidoreductase [Candidatus Pelethousia sp.]